MDSARPRYERNYLTENVANYKSFGFCDEMHSLARLDPGEKESLELRSEFLIRHNGLFTVILAAKIPSKLRKRFDISGLCEPDLERLQERSVKKSTSPRSSEYSAPTTARPSFLMRFSSTSEP